jgi:hypothetical protein
MPPKMISPICDGVAGVDALVLVVDVLVVVPLCRLLLLAAAVLPGVKGGKLRVSTA